MNTTANLVIAWLWILLGFISGLVLGLKFHDENWLGGYASWPRRLYRLGHISFFGLGAVNLMFCLTVRALGVKTGALNVASWSFLVGAITMPACCFLMARVPRGRMLFAIPVLSLITGAVFTLLQLVQL